VAGLRTRLGSPDRTVSRNRSVVLRFSAAPDISIRPIAQLKAGTEPRHYACIRPVAP